MTDQPTFELAAATSLPAFVSPAMDPRLQWLIVNRQVGGVRAATASTERNEIAVIAKVSDPAKWEALSEVRTPTLIGKIAQSLSIVTGRIPISRIEAVRSQSFVKSLKASQELRPQLDQTVIETEATEQLLPTDHLANGGDGTIVGVIDYGGDFAHANFRNDDGSTRLLTLWDQDGITTTASPFEYGREHTTAAINLALQKPNPYVFLRYDPGQFSDPDDPGAHGTHVMDIAAGNGRGTGIGGMAPRAGLVFVNISHAVDPTGATVVGRSFGDSVRLLEAAKYIFDKAGNVPCVINVSLGTNGGPHDGTTLVEQGLDSLIAAAPNRSVVLAAANSFDDGIHAAGTVAAGGTADLEWEVLAPPRGNIEMEVWYREADRLTVELIDPAGVVQASVAPGQNRTLSIGNRAVHVANRLNDPNNNDNMIGIFFAAFIAPGTYTVRLRGDTIADGRFHAWIERDNRFASRFRPPHDNSHTIGTISCGQHTIAVGSYDGHKAARPLSFFTSAGPTRDGRQKPEVSAPGHNVRAALSSSGNGSRLMSGTSMAAPAVAGLVALMFAEARARNLSLQTEDVRRILVDCARRGPPTGTEWHPQYGHGRIHATAAVAAVIAMAGVAPAVAARGRQAAKKRVAVGKPKRRSDKT